MDKTTRINNLTPLVVAVIAVFSLAVTFILGDRLDPDHERMIFFSTFMISTCVYSAVRMLSDVHVRLFVAAFTVIHVTLVMLPQLKDENYYGAILAPFAIADYVILVWSLYRLRGLATPN